jgi:hypothetical protein
MCPTLDGVRTTLPDECASEPWRSRSPYCACNVLAASPNEVFVTWPAKDEVRWETTCAWHQAIYRDE